MKCECGMVVLDEAGLDEENRLVCPICGKKYVYRAGQLTPDSRFVPESARKFVSGFGGFLKKNRGILYYIYLMSIALICLLVWVMRSENVYLRKPAAGEILFFIAVGVAAFAGIFLVRLVAALRKRNRNQ